MGIRISLQYNVTIAWVIVWDPNKAIDIVEWSICRGGWLESTDFEIAKFYWY